MTNNESMKEKNPNKILFEYTPNMMSDFSVIDVYITNICVSQTLQV